MNTWILKGLKIIPIHLLFWVLVELFYVYFFSYTAEDKSFVLWFSLSVMPITIITTYLFSYYLIPNYLIPKKHFQFTVYSAYAVVCSLFLILIITFINFIFLSNFNILEMPLLTRNFVFVLIMVYVVVGAVSFVRLLQYNNKSAQLNKDLENKLLEGKLLLKQRELHYLKQQIHPHFLFNTLNTLYGFALKESKETPELILKLSSLLDYILNQIEKPKVLLSEEVNGIESYIGLEAVRFRDTLQITFDKDIQSDIALPPMVLMTFVENAFKHGAPLDGILNVVIHLKSTRESLYFEVKNSIQQSANGVANHGLGLQNVIKRLDAIYGDNYTLSILQKSDTHTILLNIQNINE